MAEKLALDPARHEPRDVGGRLIAGGVALVLGTVVALALLVLWLFPNSLIDRTLNLPLPRFPAPELQPSARGDMAAFHAREMHWLDGTGWLDKARGTIHIPIADAMRKLADEGIPGWPTPSGAPP